jgi:inosine/xanthosine triphosphatase
MKIVIGSRNAAKSAACKSILGEVYEDAEFVNIDASSGVSDMPMDNETTVTGAKNRAIDAFSKVEGADLAIGLEGGVYTGPEDMMILLGWVAIFDGEKFGIGHSGGVVLPKDIAEQLKAGAELGPLMHTRLGDDIRHNMGTTGVLTNGLYPRNREFEDALRNALAPFVSPEFY